MQYMACVTRAHVRVRAPGVPRCDGYDLMVRPSHWQLGGGVLKLHVDC